VHVGIVRGTVLLPILHDAAKEPIHGAWMSEELASPGALTLRDGPRAVREPADEILPFETSTRESAKSDVDRDKTSRGRHHPCPGCGELLAAKQLADSQLMSVDAHL
jgi:hypothetical protein